MKTIIRHHGRTLRVETIRNFESVPIGRCWRIFRPYRSRRHCHHFPVLNAYKNAISIPAGALPSPTHERHVDVLVVVRWKTFMSYQRDIGQQQSSIEEILIIQPCRLCVLMKMNELSKLRGNDSSAAKRCEHVSVERNCFGTCV